VSQNAARSGGGLSNWNFARMRLSASTVHQNQSECGGGITNLYGEPIIERSTISASLL